MCGVCLCAEKMVGLSGLIDLTVVELSEAGLGYHESFPIALSSLWLGPKI